MSFIDDSEKNVKKLMKEVSGGSVGGFVGRAGMGIDDLFAGSFHPDSGHGSKNLELLTKQVKDRKQKRRAKNALLIKFGRTKKQIARWKKKNKGKSMMEKKRW